MQRIDDADNAQALKLLLQDHRRIRRLLARAQGGSRDARSLAAARACEELEAHAALEERLLYPLIATVAGHDSVDAARAEHDLVHRLVARLKEHHPASEDYASLLRDLAEAVDAHVQREEDALMPCVSGSNIDLAPLAHALLERQRTGALTDVDVDADRAIDAASHESPAEAQRVRTPERRGAH